MYDMMLDGRRKPISGYSAVWSIGIVVLKGNTKVTGLDAEYQHQNGAEVRVVRRGHSALSDVKTENQVHSVYQ